MNSQSNMNQNFAHKKNPFTVPEGYFETFPDKVMKQIQELPTAQKPTVVRIIFRRQLAIAAGFIGFFLLSYTFIHFLINKPNEKNQQLAQQTTSEDIVMQRVSEHDIIEAFDTDKKTPVDGDAIEDYLLDENIHEATLSDYLNK
jgi:hypothetical protein